RPRHAFPPRGVEAAPRGPARAFANPGSVSLVLFLAAALGGAAATYLYDDDAPLGARLAAGGPIGLALFGLGGFAAALLLGVGPAAIAAGVLAAAAPLLALARPARRR